MDAAHRRAAGQEAGRWRKKQPAGAMDAAHRRAARQEAGRQRKKQPAGALDGPAGVKKWRGQDSNL
jgi:hypothetical protein